MTEAINNMAAVGNSSFFFLVFICAAYGAYKFGCDAYKKYKGMSPEDLSSSLKDVVTQIILYEMVKAEEDWQGFTQAGELKKSQVISALMEKFPEIAENEALIKLVSDLIEQELPKLQEFMTKQLSA